MSRIHQNCEKNTHTNLLNNILSTRIDSILIFGHGMQYFNNIIADIRLNQNFEILMIHKHNPKDIKKFVRSMYSHDYAPFWHLESKTKYLLKTPKEVCFIFIRSFVGSEDYLGEHEFRHKESLTLKLFKETIRDKYNPRKDGKRTHDHVIHATNSQTQAHYALKYLGFKNGVELFDNPSVVIDKPYHLKNNSKYKIKCININDLYCNIIYGDSWHDYHSKQVHIRKSPQYLGINSNIDIYKSYINKFIGGPLKDNYDINKYQLLSKDFKYLEAPYESSFIIVKRMKNEKYVILDGLHRASISLMQNNATIQVCQIIK